MKKAREYVLKEMNEIRRLQEKGLRPLEIMDAMHMPQSTYYDLMQKIYAQDLYQIEKEGTDALATEILKLKDRLLDSYRNLQILANQASSTVRERVDAENLKIKVAVNLFRLHRDGPRAVALTGGTHKRPSGFRYLENDGRTVPGGSGRNAGDADLREAIKWMDKDRQPPATGPDP